MLGLTALLACAPPASAQTLIGRVVDAGSGLGVVGAIVAALGSGDEVQTRSLTRGDGGFSLRLPVGFEPSALRVERIGYAPQTFPVAEPPAGEVLALRVTATPVLLEGISALAESLCGNDVQRDRLVYDVWQEARKSLQTQALSVEESILSFQTEAVVRSLDPRTREVLENSTQQRLINAPRPYRAISAEQMTTRGWAEDSDDGSIIYYAPDATLLLSDEFTNQHCFAVDRSDEGILLTFEPNNERLSLPELEGVMILDAASLELTAIRFRYVGLPFLGYGQESAEGEVMFYAAPNGLRIVREWAIRMPVATQLRTSFRDWRVERIRIDYLREEGGRVLRVRTRDSDLVLGPVEPAPTLALGPVGPATTNLPAALAERLVTWSSDDPITGGIALFLRNGLSEGLLITGIELRGCINVGISCTELHPVLMPLAAGQEGRLFVVPRANASSSTYFVWNFTGGTQPAAQPTQ
jgi:hypothetical protein